MKKYNERLSEEAKLLDDYLGQYKTCIQNKRNLELRRMEILREFSNPLHSPNYDGMPHGSSEGLGSAQISLHLDEIDTQIREQISRTVKTLGIITDVIQILPENSRERAIIEAKYIDRLKWYQICQKYSFERAQAIRIWKKGLYKILENEEIRKVINKEKRRGNKMEREYDER